MKALVTGSEGFVGGYLCAELENSGYEIVRCSLDGGDGRVSLNVLDESRVNEIIASVRPGYIFHLAGQANVALSWKYPRMTMELNTVGMINILEAVRRLSPGTRVIGIGSSDEYGRLGESGRNVTEDIPLAPLTPYAVSKVAQENTAFAYHKAYGTDVCMTRCFNMSGAGQPRGFLIPDIASGIAAVENGRQDTLRVGNLEPSRDITHIKDAVRALRLVGEKGVSGEVYNIGSGTVYPVREVVEKLCAMAECPIAIEPDREKFRPSDTPIIRCGNGKLRAHTGWAPELTLDDILADTLEYFRNKEKPDRQ